MPEQDAQQELSVDTPLGKLAAKGVRISDLLGILTFLGVIATIYFGLQALRTADAHGREAKEVGQSIAASIKDGARAQRMMTCIISMPQERREQEFTQPNSFCSRIAALP